MTKEQHIKYWVDTAQYIPPKVHNVHWLLEQSNIDLGEETMNFLVKFNDFQLEGRYPDYKNDIYKLCTKEFTKDKLEKIKEIRQCLIEML